MYQPLHTGSTNHNSGVWNRDAEPHRKYAHPQAQLDPHTELAQLLAQGLNAEQQQVFDLVQEAYNDNNRAMIFVQV